jgi:ribosomal protein L37AE/L43A
MKKYVPRCFSCGDTYELERMQLGYAYCLSCGDEQAKAVKHCIVPINKSNYMVVTDYDLLKQLNPKRTIA